MKGQLSFIILNSALLLCLCFHRKKITTLFKYKKIKQIIYSFRNYELDYARIKAEILVKKSVLTENLKQVKKSIE